MIIILDAFKLHDQEGIPLDMQHDMAKMRGAEINLAAFACDALGAGWPEKRVEQVIKSARPDVDWTEFMHQLAALWTVSGKLPDPEMWVVMKDYIVTTRQRMEAAV